MKRLAWGALAVVLTVISAGFIAIVLTMPPAPPEWSREATETDLAGLLFSCVVLTTWISTWFTWRKTFKH